MQQLVNVDGATVDLSKPEGWYAFFTAPEPAESQADGFAESYPNGCPILPEGDE